MIAHDDSWWSALALWSVEGIGAARYAALEHAFGSAAEAWRAGPAAWAEALRRPNLAAVLEAGCAFSRPERLRDELARLRVRALHRAEGEFPARLAELGALPWLFVRGGVAAFEEPLAALVGTRGVRPDGVRLSEQVTAWSVERGYGTVSGGALGVDTAVHRTSLRLGARTVVVLPAGHGCLAPASNRGLFDSVCAAGGCLVSEHPPWRPARDRLFARRNRLISGLSVLTIVIRAPLRSGALITADWALRQGRPLYAVPGMPGDPTAAGCIELIRRGARMLGARDDLPPAGRSEPAEVVPEGAPEGAPHDSPGANGLPPKAFALLHELSQGVGELEELVARLQWTPAEVMGELTRLLLAGRVEAAGPGRYVAKQPVRSR